MANARVVSWVVSRLVTGVVSGVMSGVKSGEMAWGTESRVSGMKVWVRTATRKAVVLFKMTNCLGNLDHIVVRDLHIVVIADRFVFFMTFFVIFVLANLLMWVVVFMANLKHKKDWYVKSHILPSKKINELYFYALSLTKKLRSNNFLMKVAIHIFNLIYFYSP